MLINSEKKKCLEVRRSLNRWFRHYGRDFPWRSESTPIYEMIVTEILLQRTKAETVSSIYSTFFTKFDSWDRINKSSLEEIQQLIKPLGIWRRRSITLKNLAYEMVQRQGCFPNNRNEIDKLPGVGQYVGNAIEMFYFDRPMPLLDTNMARVIERVFKPRKLADIRYDPWLQAISKEMVSSKNVIHLNWALLDIGGTLCKPRNPNCSECPINSLCNYSTVKEIPTHEKNVDLNQIRTGEL